MSALLDRLLHHVVLFAIKGESYRIKGPKKAGEKHNESDD
ncbi:MAG: ATP-binding protein [bacterium]